MRLRELPSERAQRCCRNRCSLRSASYIALWGCDHAPGVCLVRRVRHREKMVEEVVGHRGLHIVVAQRRRRDPLSKPRCQHGATEAGADDGQGVGACAESSVGLRA